MKIRCGKSQLGIALIIVMVAVTVLAVLAAGFAYSMKVEMKLARNANSETQLEWIGRSGVEYARWILAEQMKIAQEPYDAPNQKWAGGPGGLGTTNSPLADISVPLEFDLQGGHGKLTINDLERKANINTANEALLQQALILMGVDAGDMTPIINCILDWIDPDDNPRVQGAESDFYQNQTPPYLAKNGPIDDMSELLLIKNITPELYWGLASTNHPPAAFQPKRGFGNNTYQGPAITSGLVDLFTPISSGKININTASADVLQLIPGVDRVMAEAIVAGRQGEEDGSGLTGPYRNVGEVQRVPEIPRPLINNLMQFCDVRSRTFEVLVDAEVGGYRRQFVAILARNNPRDIQVLTFYWK